MALLAKYSLFPNLTFLSNSERWSYSTYNGGGILTKDAYSSEHLVLPYLGFASVLSRHKPFKTYLKNFDF